MTDDHATRPPLDHTRLIHGLAGAPGVRVEIVEAAASTNALVAERARTGEAAGLVIVAEHQTAGRGRLDRTWQTPPRAALTFSVLLRPTVPASAWPWIPLLTGYAVSRGLRDLGVPAEVKWPNDLLLGGLKIAGILAERVESGSGSESGAAAVVGVGLNVSTRVEELPVPTATSLAIALGREPDRTAVLLGCLRALFEEYAAWQAAPATLRAAYAGTCATIGQQVRVHLPSGADLLGEATGVDAEGRLVVRTGDGEVAVSAGDVVHVRRVGQ